MGQQGDGGTVSPNAPALFTLAPSLVQNKSRRRPPSLPTRRRRRPRSPLEETLFPILKHPANRLPCQDLGDPWIQVVVGHGAARRRLHQELVGLGTGLDLVQEAGIRARSGDERGGGQGLGLPEQRQLDPHPLQVQIRHQESYRQI
ncbi:hypothetical protein LINPERPRIM_LOCUS474 [Linum perenne]